MASTVELTAAVTRQTAQIERLVDSVDSVDSRLVGLEVKVEERTRSIVREDTMRAMIAEHTAACRDQSLDRKAMRGGKPSSWPARYRAGERAKVFGLVGGAGTGLAAVGYALWHLFQWILASH